MKGNNETKVLVRVPFLEEADNRRGQDYYLHWTEAEIENTLRPWGGVKPNQLSLWLLGPLAMLAACSLGSLLVLPNRSALRTFPRTYFWVLKQPLGQDPARPGGLATGSGQWAFKVEAPLKEAVVPPIDCYEVGQVCQCPTCSGTCQDSLPPDSPIYLLLFSRRRGSRTLHRGDDSTRVALRLRVLQGHTCFLHLSGFPAYWSQAHLHDFSEPQFSHL